MRVKDNLQQIPTQINDGNKKNSFSTKPNMITVIKYVTIERTKGAYEARIRHFGKNRLEDFFQKKEALPSDVVVHLIGSLQSREIKGVINDVNYFHALDRLSSAKEISKRTRHKIKCFLQVNVSGEAPKHDTALEDADQFINDLKKYDKIGIVSLMTTAPLTDDEAYIRPLFKQLHLKREEIQRLDLEYVPCDELSMGMSNDYLIAAEEGAMPVRIGTRLAREEE